jgi:hypothetical protein
VSRQLQNNNLIGYDEDGGDGATSGGHYPKFDRCHESTKKQLSSFEHEADPSTRNLSNSSGVAGMFITHQDTMLWHRGP